MLLNNFQVEGSDSDDDNTNNKNEDDDDDDEDGTESLEFVVDNDVGEEIHLKKMAEQRKESSNDDTEEAENKDGDSSASRKSQSP